MPESSPRLLFQALASIARLFFPALAFPALGETTFSDNGSGLDPNG